MSSIARRHPFAPLACALLLPLSLAVAAPAAAAVADGGEASRPPPLPPGVAVRVDRAARVAILHGRVTRPIDRLLARRAVRARVDARHVIDALVVTPPTVTRSRSRPAPNEPRRRGTKPPWAGTGADSPAGAGCPAAGRTVLRPAASAASSRGSTVSVEGSSAVRSSGPATAAPRRATPGGRG